MSERPVVELYKPPIFAACDCLNCGSGIEFDASDFAEDETRTVKCPHLSLSPKFGPVAK
jgi:hypothetical protein